MALSLQVSLSTLKHTHACIKRIFKDSGGQHRCRWTVIKWRKCTQKAQRCLHVLRHFLMTAVRAVPGEQRCYRWHCDGRFFHGKTLSLSNVCALQVLSSKHARREDGTRAERRRGVEVWGEGFMSVIMKSQWPGCWHWDISSHSPPIIRRMNP